MDMYIFLFFKLIHLESYSANFPLQRRFCLLSWSSSYFYNGPIHLNQILHSGIVGLLNFHKTSFRKLWLANINKILHVSCSTYPMAGLSSSSRRRL